MIGIPVDKINKGTNMITSVLNRLSKKVTVLELQKLSGFLNFLGRAIIPGRAFTRRLYSNLNPSLKQHHHIHINNEMRSDLTMLLKFLRDPSAYSRPFIDFLSEETEEIDFYTDASNSIQHRGCGGKCLSGWFYQKWDREFIAEKKPSIAYLELYTMTVGFLLWIEKFRNKRITIFCDNKSARDMLNNNSSKC